MDSGTDNLGKGVVKLRRKGATGCAWHCQGCGAWHCQGRGIGTGRREVFPALHRPRFLGACLTGRLGSSSTCGVSKGPVLLRPWG